MKEIKLSKGEIAIVDDDWYEMLKHVKWHTQSSGYAVRREINNCTGKKESQYMHRIIKDIADSSICIDHINDNKMDNREINLRKCTKADNNRNMGITINNKSGFKGVHWSKKSAKWVSQISKEGSRFNLGSFDNKEDAAKAYNKKALELFGEFAYLNKIEGGI